MIVKWSKTLQTKNKIKVIKVPSLGRSTICPVAAVKKVLSTTPGSNNSPLFQIKCYSKWVPLSDTRLRKTFSKIMDKIQKSPSGLTFHSLRCSGATLAFNMNVPMQYIQSHGTCMSEAVWTYITHNHNASLSMASSFQTLLHVYRLMGFVFMVLGLIHTLKPVTSSE